MVSLLKLYSDSYCSNQYRALQQFLKWWSDDEDLPDPMAKTKPPTVDLEVVPVFTDDELNRLTKACESRSFEQRRDYAIISLFKATGMRLSELAGIEYRPDDPERNDLDLTRREVRVRGKAGKQRIVRFGHPTARAIDRYLRVRVKHKWADHPKLWLGINNRKPMTSNGIYQMIVRRGRQSGVAVFPHKFRHDFSHRWLDNGGAEGDLMELNGWSSEQMLRRYGASARGVRARRSYDRTLHTSPALRARFHARPRTRRSCGSSRPWAPLEGQYYALRGSATDGTEEDVDPFERNPPRMAPPYFQGTVANEPRLVTFKTDLRNVPLRDNLALGAPGSTTPRASRCSVCSLQVPLMSNPPVVIG